MLSAVLTLRLDLPHTSPGNVSCVYSDFSFRQPRLPQARAIYLCVFLIELTGRQQQPQRQQRRNKERQGWKRQTQMLRGGKKEETR